MRMIPAAGALSAAIIAAIPQAQAQDQSTLVGTCFSRAYSPEHLADNPGQRVSDISVQFQGFEGSLLASVIYTLRFGTRFGFGADCYEKIEGGFLCRACAGDSCQSSGETFKILFGDEGAIRLVNDSTGMVAENPDGGRDYLRSDGEHGEFILYRGLPESCAW